MKHYLILKYYNILFFLFYHSPLGYAYSYNTLENETFSNAYPSALKNLF